MKFPSAGQRRKRSLEVTSDSSDTSDSGIVRRVRKNARLESDSGNGGRLETQDVPVQEPQPSSSKVINLNDDNRSSPGSSEVPRNSLDSSVSNTVRRAKKNAKLRSDSGNGGRLETKDVPVQEPQPSSSKVINLNEDNRSSPDSSEVPRNSLDSSVSNTVRWAKKNARLKSDSGNGGRLEIKDVPMQEPQPSSSKVINLNEENRSSPDSSEVTRNSLDSSVSNTVRRAKKNARLKSDSGNGGRLEIKDVPVQEPQPSSSKVINLNEDNRSSPESSYEHAEKCPICLTPFKNQEVGSPEACNHSFCAECIQKWAKSENTCPLDRRKFNLILVRSHYNGQYVRSIKVQELRNNALEEEEEDLTCTVCGVREVNEESLVYCMYCDCFYHLDCLEGMGVLSSEDEWFCPECSYVHNAVSLDDFLRRVLPPVQEPRNNALEEEEEDLTCTVCGVREVNEESLVYCMYCDCYYHLDCLEGMGVLSSEDEWFCPECSYVHNAVSLDDFLRRVLPPP